MYAILTVIVGTVVGEKAQKWLEKHAKQYDDEWDSIGITTKYSGGASHIPAYCGVKLGEMDEATDYMPLQFAQRKIGYTTNGIDKIKPSDYFSFEPTAEQLLEANELMDKLPKELRDLMPPLGVYMVWSTS